MPRTIKEWQCYFEEIAHDLAWCLMIRKVEAKTRELLSPLFEISEAARDCHHYAYGVERLMSLRRQCTMQPRFSNQVSLLRFLSDLRDDARGPQTLHRGVFVAMSEVTRGMYQEGGEIQKFYAFVQPDEIFDRFSERWSQVLDTTKIENDIAAIKAAYEPIAPYVDKSLAHLERAIATPPQIRQGEMCIDICWSLFEKYHPLIFGKPHMSEIGIGPEAGWEKAFDQLQIVKPG